MRQVHDDPSRVSAIDGIVRALGPDSIKVDLTPAAALETANRLIDAAAKAEGQKQFANRTARQRK
ncbi:hypothetical protein [Sphingomonas prati]|uniref:Uncharacterized protein n=1 Tax=Sphingomonas prati TaxID=1843237 RepID=A0A7W9BSM5_9SPHN|nr:hypothetical protein [Sphingomonas prati]MBB5729373.1 hypothetical protein [Sphingomonas prati]GGE77919.1 hypothetical protein GCM10011404_08300 [Sphingomonas prati]